MEKKKLLLVAVSVGVFLVIVVSAAILVFSPSGKRSAGTDWRSPSGAGLAASRPATADPHDMLDAPELRSLQNPAPSVQETAESGGDLTIDRKTGTVITIQPSQTASGDTAQQPQAAAAEPAKPAQEIPVAAVPVPAVSVRTAQPREAPKASVSPAVPPAKPAASVVAPQKKTIRDFWIQAGSYSTRDRADNAKDTLNGKGITALITNQQVNGQTFYRVRIGPYTSRNEADYWLAMIKSINGFEGSQVWESQTKR